MNYLLQSTWNYYFTVCMCTLGDRVHFPMLIQNDFEQVGEPANQEAQNGLPQQSPAKPTQPHAGTGVSL